MIVKTRCFIIGIAYWNRMVCVWAYLYISLLFFPRGANVRLNILVVAVGAEVLNFEFYGF